MVDRASVPWAISSLRDDWAQEFALWLETGLRREWRDVGFGADEKLHVAARQGWGRALWEGGWAAPNVPRDAGGLGLSPAEVAIYQQLVVTAGAPEPLNSNAIGVLAPTMLNFGTKDQCAKYLPPMLSHTEIWCQGFSEPEAGSDLAAVRTSARRVGDEYVVNGQKVWTSYSAYADWGYFLVRTEVGSSKHRGLSLLVIPMSAVEVRPIKNMVGGAEFAEVFLDDVRVPVENRIGVEGDGWRVASFALSRERTLAMLQRTLSMEREFERVMDSHPHQDRIDRVWAGRTRAKIRAVKNLTLGNLRLLATGEDLGRYPSVAKLAWSELHQQALEKMTLAGGESAAVEDGALDGLTKSLMFARAETIYGGTSEIQRNLIARASGLVSPVRSKQESR